MKQLVSVRGSVGKEPERNKDLDNSLKLDVVPMVQVDANVDSLLGQRVFILVISCVVLLRLICVLDFKIKFKDK